LIPESHRLVINVPREVSAELTDIIIRFPIKKTPVKRPMTEAEEIEFLNYTWKSLTPK
jgi:hypothetical protein